MPPNTSRVATLLLLASALSASTAQAAPAAEPNCPTPIKTPEGDVNGAIYGEDCNTIFVLPPAIADAHVGALSLRQNLDFCPAVGQADDVAKTTFDSAAVLAERIKNMIASFDPLNATIDDLTGRLADATALASATERTLNDALAARRALEDAVRTAQAALSDCRLFAVDPSACQAETAALDAARNELRTFVQSTLAPAQRAFNDAEQTRSALAERLLAETSRAARATEPLFDLQNQLLDLNVTITTLYQQYARLGGIASTLNYAIGWANLLRAYEAANPGKAVLRMPLTEPKISAGVVFEASGESDVPGVLSYSIPGVLSGRNLMDFPPGDKIPPLGQSISPEGSVVNAFGDGIQAQLLVSLVASCPLYPNGIAGGIQGDPNSLLGNIALNVTYNYNLIAKRGYTARYNMANWLSRVEKRKKKGGFFSSKVMREIINDGNSSDWFEISFNASSPEFAYTPAEQTAIRAEVKAELQQRALNQIALQTSMLNGVPLTPLAQGSVTEVVACGGYAWCRVAGFVLGIADSIFGRAKSVDSFRQNNSAWVTETVNTVGSVTRVGSLTFEPPN